LAIKPSPTMAGSGKITGTASVSGGGGISTTGEASETLAVKAADFANTTQKQDQLNAEVKDKIADRQKARAANDFAMADAIRQELLAMGIVLEDTKDGVRWKKLGPPKA
ncbi:MAG: CysS/YqeB C-terminal domain-containing protein, partial [Candidatus Aminicenantales bacterium]